ncbi:MAG: copper chaperone PCu(A)C [Thiolinea sp.]
MKLSLTLSACLLAMLSMQSISADEYRLGHLQITDPYTRTTPPMAAVAGGFMTVTNNGTESDTFLGGSAGFVEAVEIHEMSMADGIMKMRRLENGLQIAPNETVELKPGGYHLMLIKPSEPMKEGDKHKITLSFKQAGDIEVELEVKDISATLE